MSLTTTSSNETYDPLARPAMEAAMAWYGWGSPVGMAIIVVALGVAAVLFRFALFGHF